MFRALCALVVIAAVAIAGLSLSDGQSTTAPLASQIDRPAEVIDAAASVEAPTVCERLATLPEDGNWYTASLFLHRNWQQIPAERSLVACWKTLPGMCLGKQIKFYAFDEDWLKIADPAFRRVTANLPTALIQRGDGYVISQHDGAKMFGPTQFDPERRKRHCQPAPPPAPHVDVDVQVHTPPVPAAIPATDASQSDDRTFYAILIGGCLLAATIAAVVCFRGRVASSTLVK
jgi:hypothetical protein